jgi:hypothetical protein
MQPQRLHSTGVESIARTGSTTLIDRLPQSVHTILNAERSRDAGKLLTLITSPHLLPQKSKIDVQVVSRSRRDISRLVYGQLSMTGGFLRFKVVRLSDAPKGFASRFRD